MTSQQQPHREPLRATLRRTAIIAIIAGAIAARWWGLSRGPQATLLAFWPSFGGHWIELFFLNWLRPRLPGTRGLQLAARLAVWFIGGAVLATGMVLTANALGIRQLHSLAWWRGGLAFIGIELLVHLGLQLRGRSSFYNGRG